MTSRHLATGTLERAAERVVQRWDTVDSSARATTTTWRRAAATSHRATMRARAAAREFAEAAQQWATARERWQMAQALIVAAAAIDAAALSGQLDCAASVSTRAYRTHLARSGTPVPSGFDVDHIVPRALGGADHASNYQLLPASVNRSWGSNTPAGPQPSGHLERCQWPPPQSRLQASDRPNVDGAHPTLQGDGARRQTDDRAVTATSFEPVEGGEGPRPSASRRPP